MAFFCVYDEYKIDGITFIEQIMKVHTPYYKTIRELFHKDAIHGMAHITVGLNSYAISVILREEQRKLAKKSLILVMLKNKKPA